MKNLVKSLVIVLYLILNIQYVFCNDRNDEDEITTFLEYIINAPPNMIYIMKSSKTIDCSEFITDLKNNDENFIEFVMEITYLRCRKYKFVDIHVQENDSSEEKEYFIYYSNEDYKQVIFNFIKKDNKIIFIGIVRGID